MDPARAHIHPAASDRYDEATALMLDSTKRGGDVSNTAPRARGLFARICGGAAILTLHGTAPSHRYAFWVAVIACACGVINTIATSVVFMTVGSPVMTPRVGPFLDWRFGLVPDSTQTFSAALIAMGVGVGFSLSAFRFVAFREREIRRLDFILTLLQLQPLLWFTLRACMLLPRSAGLLASIRETFLNVLSFAFYISCAQPHSHRVLYVASFALIVYLIGIVDRAIVVGAFGQFQFGVYLQPVIGPDSTGRYFAYLLVTELCRCVTIWLCAEQLGSDKNSRRLFFVVAVMQPLAALSLQIVRVVFYAAETTPGNVVFISDVYTSCAAVFGYTISSHWMLYARMQCKDSLGQLERRVRELNSQAAVSEAVANAQKEFTRYIFHEVRGPLNNIGLGVELLSGFPAVQEHAEMKEIVSLMGESTTIVRRITDDVLFIAKVESDQFSLIFSPFSASDLIYSVVHQQSAPASVKGVTLSTTVQPEIPALLLGDGNRIRQIITNLASNAIKFVPERTGHVRIAVSSRSRLVGDVASEQGPPPSASINYADSGGRPIPGSINRRSFASGLASGSFGQYPAPRSRSATVYPSDAPVDEIEFPPVASLPAAAGTAKLWPWSVLPRSLSRRLLALRRMSAPIAPVAEDQLRQPAADLEAGVGLSGHGVISSDPGSEKDPRLPFSVNLQGDACPHIVDLPEDVIATSAVVTLRFEVNDNGRGLSAEQRDQLFKPYAQISTSRNHGGTGLGLYISMRLAKQMGGRIGVDSEGEGRGSTFWCEIPVRVLERRTSAPLEASSCVRSFGTSAGTGLDPIVPPMHSTAESTQAAMPVIAAPALRPTVPLPSSTQSSSAPITAPIEVLIVDDVDSIRMLMRRLLKQHAPAAIIHEAADGLAACEMITAAKEAGAPLFSRGIICMDKEMPQCDGFAATKRIRGMGFAGRILGITGNAIAEDVDAFLACGADVVLTKPLSFPIFLGHLRTFARDASVPGRQTDLPPVAVLSMRA